MVDAQSFPRLSDRFGVYGVPLTVVNGSEQLTGAVPEAQVTRAIRAVLRH